jgi:hypothetical protein
MTDWKEVWKSALQAGTAKLDGVGPDATKYLKECAAAHKAALESLLAAFADGKIDKATLESELDVEKRVLKTELLAVQASAKKAAQDAANAFFDVIETALKAGIGGLL